MHLPKTYYIRQHHLISFVTKTRSPITKQVTFLLFLLLCTNCFLRYTVAFNGANHASVHNRLPGILIMRNTTEIFLAKLVFTEKILLKSDKMFLDFVCIGQKIFYVLLSCCLQSTCCSWFFKNICMDSFKAKKREVSPAKSKHMDYSLCDLVIDHISNKKGIHHELLVNKKIQNLIKI